MKSVKGIKSIENFRDLGGIRVKGGRVKSGMLYRSAQTGTADEKDVECFKTLGIKHIFDFRDEAERQMCPDFSCETAEIHFTPASQEKDEAFKQLESRPKSEIKFFTSKEAETYERLFAQSYGKTAERNPAFKSVFDTLDEGCPILFHCVGGKDRTGIMAALILLALGASKKAVMRDYMLTNRYYFKKNFKCLFKVFVKRRNFGVVRVLGVYMCASRRNMQTVFDAIESKYASYDEFFYNEYGITAERIKAWRRFYVEEK